MKALALLLAAAGASCSANVVVPANQSAVDNNIEIGRQELENRMAAEPCLRRLEDGTWDSLPARDCVQLSAQREMRGTWMAGMEDSTFVPDNPDSDLRGERVWLEMELADALRSGVMPNENTPAFGMFAIQFVGRRSRQRGHYGHLGMSPHVVVVDRIISVRRTGEYRYLDGLRYSDPP